MAVFAVFVTQTVKYYSGSYFLSLQIQTEKKELECSVHLTF